MALLTQNWTPPNTGNFMGPAVDAAQLLLQERARAQAELDRQAAAAAQIQQVQEQQTQAAIQATLQASRRDFEFQKNQEFKDRELAAQTAQQTRNYGLAEREVALREKADSPFPLLTGGSTTPTGTSGEVSGSSFGLVPDGKGGWMKDPQDNGLGASGIVTADEGRRGVALSPEQLRAAGINSKAEWDKYRVELFDPKTGKRSLEPIVDILGTPGRVDMAPATYKLFGGPTERGGGLIPGLQFKVVKNSGGSSYDLPQAGAESNRVTEAIRSVQAAGVRPTTRQVGQLAVNIASQKPSNAQTGAAIRSGASPIVRVNPDGSIETLYTPDKTDDGKLSPVDRQKVLVQKAELTHAESNLTRLKKELDKLPAAPVVWPWKEDGKYYQMAGNTRLAISEKQFNDATEKGKKQAADRKAKEDEIALLQARREEANSRIDSLLGETPSTASKALDKATAAAILQEAGGDKEKARAMARARGYTL